MALSSIGDTYFQKKNVLFLPSLKYVKLIWSGNLFIFL